jgi:UDP-N-acetylmuramate--alanine ligase
MPLFAPNNPRPLHFMGVAGAGMSALALLARKRGVAVTGCDNNPEAAGALEAVEDVRRAGGEVFAGHSPDHLEQARALIVSSAVPKDHPEVERAHSLGIPVVRRAEALAEAVSTGMLVAIAGTHGKTTTTAMTTEALAAAGLNPTGIVGGRIGSWGGNALIGGVDIYVVEADEYDKSFLALKPEVAVINNVEPDHLECYNSSVDNLEAAFAEFAGPARTVIVGGDDAGALRVAKALGRSVWRVGFTDVAEVRISRLVQSPAGSSALVSLPNGRPIDLRLSVPGVHSVRNAAAALAVAVDLGADLGKVLESLAAFRGVGRRFDVVGEFGAVVVVDDYAHHPSEIAAAVEAARQAYPSRRLVAVFQPHLFSRTRAMGAEMGSALRGVDVAVVADVYPARESPIPGVTGRLVADAAEGGRAEVHWVPARKELVGRLAGLVEAGDVVLTMGAGDVTAVGPGLLDVLRRREGVPA